MVKVNGASCASPLLWATVASRAEGMGGMDGFFMHSRVLLDRTACDKRLTAADRQVLDVAMRNSRSPGDPVALGLDFLMGKTGLYRSTIITSKRRLVELGYLVPCEHGQRGLAYFKVTTGSVETTGRVETTGSVGTTGTGSVETTGTGSVGTTHIDTGNMETTAFPSNDEKPPRRSPEEDSSQNPNPEDEPTDNPSFQGGQTPSAKAEPETPPPSPEPAKLELTPPPTDAKDDSTAEPKAKGKSGAKKATVKAQPVNEIDAAAERVVDLYAKQVKPKTVDNSGSRKTFLATATRILADGVKEEDLEASIRNYLSARLITERKSRTPADEIQFRFGFQSFFGPKFEHWRDYVSIDVQTDDSGGGTVQTATPAPAYGQGGLAQIKELLGIA